MFRPSNYRVTPKATPIRQFFASGTSGIDSFIHFDVVQTPGYRPGLWQLDASQRLNLWAKHKMYLPPFKRMLTQLFLDPYKDGLFEDMIRNLSHKFFPVRTGRLYDMFCKSFQIIRAQYYKTHLMVFASWTWDPKRPMPIMGKVGHAPPETGYGELYHPSRSIPNVFLLYVLHGTGIGMYLLNDPQAFHNPSVKVQEITGLILEKDFRDRYNALIFTMHL